MPKKSKTDKITPEPSKHLIELINILINANTQEYNDLVNQHEHYLFDDSTFAKIGELKKKLMNRVNDPEPNEQSNPLETTVICDDVCKTKTINGIIVQENGILRNIKGRIIARLVKDVDFNSKHLTTNTTCHQQLKLNAIGRQMDDLKDRVDKFNILQLPGQLMMHMGTSYLVNDLWKTLNKLLEIIITGGKAGK